MREFVYGDQKKLMFRKCSLKIGEAKLAGDEGVKGVIAHQGGLGS